MGVPRETAFLTTSRRAASSEAGGRSSSETTVRSVVSRKRESAMLTTMRTERRLLRVALRQISRRNFTGRDYPNLGSRVKKGLVASHPEGSQKGSQGQAKRCPWNVRRRTRAPAKGARS